MIVDTIANASKYFSVHPLFQRHLNLSGKPIWRMLLMGNRIYQKD